MRIAAIALVLIAGGAAAEPARAADPYQWCAHYSGNGGNGTNCYFMTLEQCRATVSGVGGSCGINPFYTGPERATPPRRARAR